MANITKEQLKKIYQSTGAKTAEQRANIVGQLRNSGLTIGGFKGVEGATKPISAFEGTMQVAGEMAGDLGKSTVGTLGYVAGSVPRLYQGTAQEGIGGVGDVLQAFNPLNKDDIATRLKNAAQGVARTVTAPASGATKAITDRTIGELAQSTGKNFTQGVQTVGSGLSNIGEGLMTGQGEKILKGIYGGIIGGGQQALFSPVGAALEKTPIGQGAQYVGKEFMKQATPYLGENAAQAALQIPSLLGGVKMAQGLNTAKFTKGVGDMKGTISNLKTQPVQTTTQLGKQVIKPVMDLNKASVAIQSKLASVPLNVVRKALKGLSKEALSRASGLQKESMEFIVKNPDIGKKILSGKVSREDNLNSVLRKVDDTYEKLSYKGKGYDAIRKQDGFVVFKNNPIDDIVSEYGISVGKNGKLSLSKDSRALTSSDLAKVQELYDIYKGKKFTPSQILNMRQKIDKMKVFTEGQSPEIKNIASYLRSKVDKTAKKQIPGLKELDDQYAPLRADLDILKEKIYDRQGRLKDNAESIVASWTNKSKTGRMEKIDKIMPGLNKQIQSVKVLEDVANASQQQVGSYVRSAGQASAVGLAATGNIPAAGALLAVQAATHPAALARILQKYGVARNKVAPIIEELSKQVNLNIPKVPRNIPNINSYTKGAIMEQAQNDSTF